MHSWRQTTTRPEFDDSDDEESDYPFVRKEKGQKEDRRTKEEKDAHNIHSLPGIFQLSI